MGLKVGDAQHTGSHFNRENDDGWEYLPERGLETKIHSRLTENNRIELNISWIITVPMIAYISKNQPICGVLWACLQIAKYYTSFRPFIMENMTPTVAASSYVSL